VRLNVNVSSGVVVRFAVDAEEYGRLHAQASVLTCKSSPTESAFQFSQSHRLAWSTCPEGRQPCHVVQCLFQGGDSSVLVFKISRKGGNSDRDIKSASNVIRKTISCSDDVAHNFLHGLALVSFLRVVNNESGFIKGFNQIRKLGSSAFVLVHHGSQSANTIGFYHLCITRL
jgi:hypothetical protein